MKRQWTFVLVVCLTVFIAGTVLAQEPRFSIPLPLTGSNAAFGEIEKNSYLIAMEEINAKGGIKGKNPLQKN
jgi:branched-chain amino acid transport system substrate-binding protein